MNVLFCAGVRASEKYVWESAVASGEKRIMVTQVQNILVWQDVVAIFYHTSPRFRTFLLLLSRTAMIWDYVFRNDRPEA